MRRVGLVAALLVLAGCWTVPGAGPQRSGHNPFEATLTATNVASLSPEWTWQAEWTTPRAVRDPIASPAGVHISVGHKLVTVDPATGAERWRAVLYDAGMSTAPSIRTGAPSFEGETVLVPLILGNSGGTNAYDAQSGHFEGTVASGALDVAIPRAGRIVGTTLNVIGSSGLVVPGYFVKDLHNPAASWSAAIELGGEDSAIPSSPAVGGDGFFFSDGNTVYAYPFTEPTNCFNPYPPTVPIRLCPPTWSRSFGDGLARPTLTPDDQTLVVSDAGRVWALLPSTGVELWSGTLPTEDPPSGPASVDGDHVVVPTAGRLAVFDRAGCGAATCNPVWTAETRGTVSGQPAISGGVVYTATTDGVFRAFPVAGCGATTCAPLWEYQLGVQITGAPAVSLGRLFIGTVDGRLIAFRATSNDGPQRNTTGSRT